MANRKARGKQPDLLYHNHPSAESWWRWILNGDPSAVITETRPKAIPPDVPTTAFLREQRSFTSRLARERAHMDEALRALKIRDETRRWSEIYKGLPSERYLEANTDIPRQAVHRILEKDKLYSRMLAYLERTHPQRLKKKLPQRSAKKRPIRRKP